MASAVHKNTETKAASVNVNSVCRQNTAEQGMLRQMSLWQRFSGPWQCGR